MSQRGGPSSVSALMPASRLGAFCEFLLRLMIEFYRASLAENVERCEARRSELTRQVQALECFDVSHLRLVKKHVPFPFATS